MPGRKAASLPAAVNAPTARRSDGHILDPTGPRTTRSTGVALTALSDPAEHVSWPTACPTLCP
jgi:hypothetical protein